MKKILLYLLSINLTFGAGAVVYDPINHKQQMMNYQMMVLQKLEAVKNVTENTLQVQNQIKQLQNEARNLESLAGIVLGEENKNITKALNDISTINRNSQSILRNAEQIENNFDKVYKPLEKLQNMDSKELSEEVFKIVKNRNNNIKEAIKTASKVLELNDEETKQLESYFSKTDKSRGILESSMATKKGIDNLNSRIARLTDLQAKILLLEAEKRAEQEAIRNLEKERVNRMFMLTPEMEREANEFKKFFENLKIK